ncbi:MAG: SDR family oxidoreductase [Anaerolineales bacterium]|nr:MAG: SDR family oxidoreductase [Anaerolineales bacterium]
MGGRLEGKVAMVTGAGQGIGRGIALSLAQEGAHVVVNDIVWDTAQATAEEVKRLGRQSLAVQADVSQSTQVSELVDRASEEFDAVHILINNAGIAVPAFITELSEETWDRTLRINLKSMFLCSKAVAPLMMEQGYGKIVNLSSKSGKKGGLWLTAYCASKFGVIGFTQSLALDLAPYGINVNAICPGTVYTPLWDNVLKDAYARKLNIDPEEVRDYYSSKIPLGREVTMQEIGNVVVFLCSDESSYMTGQAINITGGQEMT